MPTYEYECTSCGARFERRQAIADEPVAACPQCHGSVRRLVSSGTALVFKGTGKSSARRGGSTCSLEQTGQTCCGRGERCGEPPCESES